MGPSVGAEDFLDIHGAPLKRESWPRRGSQRLDQAVPQSDYARRYKPWGYFVPSLIEFMHEMLLARILSEAVCASSHKSF